MRLVLPKVYPITDRHLSGLSHAEQVRRLIEAGATLIQLREKMAAPRDFYRDAEVALKVARDHKVTLIINDRVDIALALQADGVHLGQADLPPDAARKLLGAQRIIGFSTHNIKQVHFAMNEPIDYIAFGPIFDTSSKERPDPSVGLEALRTARQLVKFPLVAIGGITRANACEVLKAGADSVATISAVLRDAGSIAETFRQMLMTVGN